MRKLYNRIKAYFAEEEPEPLTCSKCGSDELYIACPDYCYDCHIKYETDKPKRKSSGELSWTEYLRCDGEVYRIYDMMTDPPFSGASINLAKILTLHEVLDWCTDVVESEGKVTEDELKNQLKMVYEYIYERNDGEYYLITHDRFFELLDRYRDEIGKPKMKF